MAILNIEMNTPEGVTLNTKGVYCDDNITVTPKLQTAVVAPSSVERVLVPSEGYAGIGRIIIKPTSDENAYYLIEIAAEDEMDSVLQNPSGGQIFKYVGPNGKYEAGTYYVIEVDNGN